MPLLLFMVGKDASYLFLFPQAMNEVSWIGGEPQEVVLKDPPLDQCLRQNLETLCGFEILELKELLSEQILFNVGIS